MPDPTDETSGPVTGAALKVRREALGLSAHQFGQLLDPVVTDRTVRRWEAEQAPVPPGVAVELDNLETETGQLIEQTVQACLDLPEPVMVTFATDEHFWSTHPEIRQPASWHRALVARIARQVPGLRIEYALVEETN